MYGNKKQSSYFFEYFKRRLLYQPSYYAQRRRGAGGVMIPWMILLASTSAAAFVTTAFNPLSISSQRNHGSDSNSNSNSNISSNSRPTRTTIAIDSRTNDNFFFGRAYHQRLVTLLNNMTNNNIISNGNMTSCTPSSSNNISSTSSTSLSSSSSPTYTHTYEKLNDPPSRYTEAHAIFGPLKKGGHVERFHVYKLIYKNDGDNNDSNTANTLAVAAAQTQQRNNLLDNTKVEEILFADIKIGDELNGHEGIVHGGIISLLFDETFGWGYETMYRNIGSNDDDDDDDDVPMAVTANLNVDFRAPLPSGSNVIIRVYQEKIEGRKIYLSARMESRSSDGDGDEGEETILYAEANALFIRIDKNKVKLGGGKKKEEGQ